MTTEHWLPIAGYEGLYEVSDHGRVRSLDRTLIDRLGRVRFYPGRILRPSIAACGYPLASLGRAHKQYVHRLVLEAFVGPCPEGMECLHGDRDKLNSRLDNLRWGTSKENGEDMVNHGTSTAGVRHGLAKLKDEDIALIHEFRGQITQSKLAGMLGISQSHVCKVQRQQRWTHLAA